MSGLPAPLLSDEVYKPHLRILTLDGGGVRGFSIFVVLEQLMHDVFIRIHGRAPSQHELPKPCDHFDLIVGTGIGGLIALMLGRLRLDIHTCVQVYHRMTKYVFETDKTIVGIPYRSTLFKASKLEQAIRTTVRDHTVFAEEGNDDENAPSNPDAAGKPCSRSHSLGPNTPRPSMSRLSGSIHLRGSSAYLDYQAVISGGEAQLIDRRPHATKTAVTAVIRGTTRKEKPVLLRSYNSNREPPIEHNATIWQAGRATSATAIAFKPIQIGHTTFLDEGSGKYNPAPVALEEAVVNEWPGRPVGLFVSIGTGIQKARPETKSSWEERFSSSHWNDFTEARNRLVRKIEECESIHRDMINEHLPHRGVDPENYVRFNFEVGQSEFYINEWNRLEEVRSKTKSYLNERRVRDTVVKSAEKLSAIHRMHELAETQFEPGPPEPTFSSSLYCVNKSSYADLSSYGGDFRSLRSRMSFETNTKVQPSATSYMSPTSLTAVELPGSLPTSRAGSSTSGQATFVKTDGSQSDRLTASDGSSSFLGTGHAGLPPRRLSSGSAASAGLVPQGLRPGRLYQPPPSSFPTTAVPTDSAGRPDEYVGSGAGPSHHKPTAPDPADPFSPRRTAVANPSPFRRGSLTAGAATPADPSSGAGGSGSPAPPPVPPKTPFEAGAGAGAEYGIHDSFYDDASPPAGYGGSPLGRAQTHSYSVRSPPAPAPVYDLDRLRLQQAAAEPTDGRDGPAGRFASASMYRSSSHAVKPVRIYSPDSHGTGPASATASATAAAAASPRRVFDLEPNPFILPLRNNNNNNNNNMAAPPPPPSRVPFDRVRKPVGPPPPVNYYRKPTLERLD